MSDPVSKTTKMTAAEAVDFLNVWGETELKKVTSQTTASTDDLLSSVATAIDAEIYRQYQCGADWEEAKDVLECLDYRNVASVAMTAINAWEKRQ